MNETSKDVVQNKRQTKSDTFTGPSVGVDRLRFR